MTTTGTTTTAELPPLDELVRRLALYALHDGLTDETGPGFHPCADPVIFELP